MVGTLGTILLAATLAHGLDVTEYGAKPDGTTDNTAFIQKAIDDCSARGGGRVTVPGGGVYKTYTLNLKNGVELHIDRGATLKSGEDPYKFPEFQPNPFWNVERSPRFNRRAMFYTVGQTNVAITGSGTIDGNAEAYHERVNGRWQRISHTNICGRCVFFVGCRDVRFDDVLVYHPCGWSTWFFDCDRVQCRGVRVECHREYPNGDGLHFGGCRDVTVSDCIIDAQDDALIVRTHQEQMKKVRPCERMAFANCVLRSNQSAIRIGWTEDGPIRDVSFDNIVCAYSRLGVQFFLPPLRDGPGEEYMDPPRGRGLVPPPQETIVPFSVENMRFSNMSINSFSAPIFVNIAGTENVDFIKNISFSHCRFRAQQPPRFRVRPEDNVRDWRFSDVTFEIESPRGTSTTDGGWWTGASPIWFPNTRDIVMDNVKWSWFPQDRPEWNVTLEQEGAAKTVTLSGARQPCAVDESTPGVRRFVYETLTDGEKSWQVKVTIEERKAAGGLSYRGKIENTDSGILVTAFEGPYFDRLRLNPRNAAFTVPQGFGRRVSSFPSANDAKVPTHAEAQAKAKGSWVSSGWYRLKDGRLTFDTGFHPGATGLTMPWASLETGFGTYYLGAHDPKAQPKRMRMRWSPKEFRAELCFDHRFFLPAGKTWEIPETTCEKVDGDWHAAAKRYRAWYDTVREVRAATPAWTQQVAGWLLVIMRQQNGQLFWPYTDLPKLCDVAERNGLDCIGLFGWTESGHDHNYPDYIPSAEAGGVEALKAGIAEAHRRGIKVYIYANGQLQQVGATTFWKEYGKDLALIKKDGSMVIQTYHKYRDIPKYEFALGCLYGKPWGDRMYALAEQAESFGADGILYDQLGIFAPFACYGKGHGHSTPDFSYAVERPAFIRTIADRIQRKNPNFAILTEGLHDTILDSIGLFHACQYGSFEHDACSIRARVAGEAARQGFSGIVMQDGTAAKNTENFPELWRYTFPELATTCRYPTPMITRTLANYAATYGLRHDLEVRYAPDRTYVLEGTVPEVKDYGTVTGKPDVKAMHAVAPAVASAYLKSICDFQRKYAAYLLTGAFVDTDGVSQTNPAIVTKRFVAADGTSAVIAWNVTDKPAEPTFAGPAPSAADAPAGTPATGPIPPDSIRLYRFAR